MNLDLIRAKVKDASGRLEEGDYSSALAEAIKRYSKARPLTLVTDLVGTGSNDLTLPSGWSADFSTITSVEYPVDNIPATVLDTDLWTLYRSPSGLLLRILHAAITVSESVRLEYTALHTEITIPLADEEAVASLAASICLRQLASLYGQTNDPTIQADAVNYQSKTDEYRRLADSFEKLYTDHLGIGGNAPVAGSMRTAAAPVADRRWRLTH